MPASREKKETGKKWGEGAVEELHSFLRKRNWRMSTCESCTGGLVSALITSIPGATDVYSGGVVAYSIEAKTGLVGVEEKTLDAYGPVSPQAAAEMAERTATMFGTEVSVSTTGVAGPELHGGVPPGTMYVGVKTPAGTFAEKVEIEDIGRKKNMEAFSIQAIKILLDYLLGGPEEQQKKRL